MEKKQLDWTLVDWGPNSSRTSDFTSTVSDFANRRYLDYPDILNDDFENPNSGEGTMDNASEFTTANLDKMGANYDQAKLVLKKVGQQSAQVIRKYPLVSVATAVGVGLLFGKAIFHHLEHD